MNSGAELFLFASPEMGHLLAEVELGRRLTSLHPQISIAILIPKLPIPNDNLDAFIRAFDPDLNPRIALVELPPLDDVPSDLNHVVLIDTLSRLYKPIVKHTVEARRLRRPTAGIVFDMFCSPMVDLADELGVPSYLFFTSGLNMLTLILHFESLKEGDLPGTYAGMSPESTPINFSGFENPVPVKVWPDVFLSKEMMLWPHFMRFGALYRRAKGILVNTFSELEAGLLSSLNGRGSVPPVYSVGPILHLPHPSSSRDPVLSWLDEQPAGSVIFFCFGSKIGSFEKAQVEEIAVGIERSGHRFLWSIREPPSDSEIFPEGFLNRTAGVGKVIGWAPQTEVLGHVAVGAFVSHCGWNSTLESIWFGVPLVAWPMCAEQQLNAFSLVVELGLAVELKMDYRFDMTKGKGNTVVQATEVEKAIRRVMEEEEGDVVRNKVKEMSFVAKKAAEVGGSSHLSLSRFMEDLIKNIDA